MGLAKATEVYGGKDFALVYGGNEMAGYHTGYAFTLGQTVGARHSHLCNAGYQYDQSAKELNERNCRLFDKGRERKMHAHIFGDLLVCSEGIRQRNSAKSPELHRHTIH